MKKLALVAGIIGGSLVLLIVAVFVWLMASPESGVKLSNEMDSYALEYLQTHGILEPSERLLAYYDVTMSMDGSEAAIVTNDRVIYHKDGRTTSIRFRDVVDIRHRYEDWIGDIFEIESQTGETIKIEIPVFNGGETLGNVLTGAWEKSRQ